MEYLIPEAWFHGVSWWWLMVIGGLAVGALVWGADRLVEGASGMALKLGMPKVIIGATIVSLGTTSPEAAVSVMAAWGGDAGLALGNAVGSIIADTALIFGLGCVLTVLPADRFVLRRQGWCQFGSALLLVGLCYGAWWLTPDAPRLGRPVGLLLLGLLVVYMYTSVQWAKEHPQGEPFIEPDDMAESTPAGPATDEQATGRPLWFQLGEALLGLAIVIVAGHVLICAVQELAEQWGVPRTVIAATLVAFGTSLPELVVGMMAIRKGHPEILVGNVIGADILNVLFVIGASAIASPLPIFEAGTTFPEIFLYIHLPVMLGVMLLFRVWIFMATRKGHFSRWQGVPLLAIYVGYVVLQYVVG